MPAEFLTDDLPIFLSDFAETLVIEGRRIEAVAEPVGYSESKDCGRCDLRIFLKTADIEGLHVDARRNLTVNGRNYVVTRRFDNHGMTELELATGRC